MHQLKRPVLRKSKVHFLHIAFCPAPLHPQSLDHFGDINEMTVNPLTAVEAGGAGLGNDLLEVAVIAISKNLGEIPVRPLFVAGIVGAPDAFKRGKVGFDHIFWSLRFHGKCLVNRSASAFWVRKFSGADFITMISVISYSHLHMSRCQCLTPMRMHSHVKMSVPDTYANASSSYMNPSIPLAVSIQHDCDKMSREIENTGKKSELRQNSKFKLAHFMVNKVNVFT